MTPIQIFIIIVNILILIEIAFILYCNLEYKKNQKKLKELSIKEDKDTQEYIREVVREEFSYLYTELLKIDADYSNINLGVTTMANQAQATFEEIK